MTKDIGRCLRPALPMNRAVFHRLGLSVGIAIALAGCGSSDRGGNTSAPIFEVDAEADAIQYSTVAGYADRQGDEAASRLARLALSDGRLLKSEYKSVITAADAAREAEYQRDKAAALAKWSASGMEAREGQDAQRLDGAAATARPDAQNTSEAT